MHHKRIYLDNAAATPVDQRVVEAMRPYFSEQYANPGALHQEGVAARSTVLQAHECIARVIEAHADEVIFTSGGTEANNLAIIGTVNAFEAQGFDINHVHVITTQIEHSSVLGPVRALEARGAQVTYLPVNTNGQVSPADLQAALKQETVLVTIGYAHNEIGVVQPIRELVRMVRDYTETQGNRPVTIHTDAAQAPAWLSCKVRSLGVDLMTLDAQKVYGPKGSGCLYRRRNVPLAPLVFGGQQEGGLRPGTEAVPLIVGCARALEIVEAERDTYLATVCAMRDHMIAEVLGRVPQAVLNGPQGMERLANNVHFSFPGLDAEQVVLLLDAQGIAASARSACLHDSEPGSYTVRALGKGADHATSALRLSLSRFTTEEECAYAIDAIVDVVQWSYAHTA